MTQADLVRLFFADGEKHTYWEYCFNTQCPHAHECAHQLSVAQKDSNKTNGCAIFPDAYNEDGKCKHFLQLKLIKMAYGLEGIIGELKNKDLGEFRVRMTGYFGSNTSYYRYKLGQIGLEPEQQQYIQKWCQQRGYQNLKFDRYTEEVGF